VREEDREVLDISGYSVTMSGLERGMWTRDRRMGNGGLKEGDMVSERKTLRARRMKRV